jgi:2-hydroxy-6-oxonona-2,4-dienedioate hydrolase
MNPTDRQPVSSMQTLHSEWISVKAGRIYTRIGGVDSRHPPVVLIHGFVLASDYMMPIAHMLTPLCRVYALDLPGYGQSDKPAHRMGLSHLADSLAEWMEALKLNTACFVGNSFGCQIIAEFAVRHAALAERLVLQGPTIDPQARTFLKQVRRLIKNSRLESPGLGWVMVRDYWRAGLRRIIATAKMALDDCLEAKLHKITVPTLVLRGSRDVLVSQEWAERMVRLLPRGQLKVIPGLAHTMNYTAPGTFVQAIRPFLGL